MSDNPHPLRAFSTHDLLIELRLRKDFIPGNAIAIPLHEATWQQVTDELKRRSHSHVLICEPATPGVGKGDAGPLYSSVAPSITTAMGLIEFVRLRMIRAAARVLDTEEGPTA